MNKLFPTSNKRNRKKGSLIDIFFVVLALMIFAIVLMFVNKAQQDVLGGLNSSGQFSGYGQQPLEIGLTKFPSMIEGIFTFVTVFLCIGAFILAFTVQYNPVVYVIFMVLLLIIILVTPALSNTYEGIYTSDPMLESSSKMPMSITIMTWFPRIAFIMSIILAIIMFTKGQNA